MVASVRRVVVGVHGSLGSLQALRYAAGTARERDALLVAVIAWQPPGGDLPERGAPEPQMRVIWRDAAVKRLEAAFEEGLGGLPPDLLVEQAVWRGAAGPVLAGVASEPDDLLVVGTGRRSPIARSLYHFGGRPVGRYLLAHARCPVVAVPPSALVEEMGRGFWPQWGTQSGTLRGTLWRTLRRHRALVPDIPDLSDK